MTSTALLEAIVWNNEGAKLLQDGRLHDATTVLRHAASVTKSLMTISCWEEVDSATMQSTADEEPSRHNESHQNSISQDEESGSFLYMHNRPIRFPTDLRHVTSLPVFHAVVQTLSVHVIFNLALVCHCYGRWTGTKAPLVGAMELYQVVLVSPDFRGNSVLHSDLSHALLQCLVFNNLAQLHREFGEHEYSLFCLNCIDDLDEKTDCLSAEEESYFLNRSEVDAIKLNLMSRHFPVAACAA